SLPPIPPITLSPIHSSSLDGLPLISVSPADYQAAAAFHNLTLLARFASSAPSINSFDAHVNSWGLSKPATVGFVDHRTFSIQLQDQVDLSIAWSRASRTFNGQTFLLLRWSQDAQRRDSPLAAVWLRLPGLPFPLHNPSFLKAFGDTLGRYLCSDARTARFKHPRAARICVELDISKPPPPAFVVAIGEIHVHQRILIESQLLFCAHCHLQGHTTSYCRTRKGKRPVGASSAVPSGNIVCGDPLIAGASSRGPNNTPPILPNVPLPKRLPGACGNASKGIPFSQPLPTRAVEPLVPPLDPLVASGQPTFVPPISPSTTPLPLGLHEAAHQGQAQTSPLLGNGQALVPPNPPLATLSIYAPGPSLLGPGPFRIMLPHCPSPLGPPPLDQDCSPWLLSRLTPPLCSFDPMSLEQSLPPVWCPPVDFFPFVPPLPSRPSSSSRVPSKPRDLASTIELSGGTILTLPKFASSPIRVSNPDGSPSSLPTYEPPPIVYPYSAPPFSPLPVCILNRADSFGSESSFPDHPRWLSPPLYPKQSKKPSRPRRRKSHYVDDLVPEGPD
ncbi:DUF4283 domain-containing protein, partial [Cephalotus follicularis]